MFEALFAEQERKSITFCHRVYYSKLSRLSCSRLTLFCSLKLKKLLFVFCWKWQLNWGRLLVAAKHRRSYRSYRKRKIILQRLSVFQVWYEIFINWDDQPHPLPTADGLISECTNQLLFAINKSTKNILNSSTHQILQLVSQHKMPVSLWSQTCSTSSWEASLVNSKATFCSYDLLKQGTLPDTSFWQGSWAHSSCAKASKFMNIVGFTCWNRCPHIPPEIFGAVQVRRLMATRVF